MSDRPNIFNYATKELSQDAMICWLLKCCHSKNNTYKSIGYDFIKFILDDKNIADKDIELEKNSPYAQYYHIDVYANVRVGNMIIPIIFEDKTNTFLHGEQEKRYTEMVNNWKQDLNWTKTLFPNKHLTWSEHTKYVFFKTGYVFDWQRNEIEVIKANLNAEVKSLYIEDMITFISKHKTKDLLLADYYEHLLDMRRRNEYSTANRCNRYFRKIFCDKKPFQYSHQEWAARNFGYIESENKNEQNRIWYSVRTGWSRNKYFVAIQQYRDEKKLTGNSEEIYRLKDERYAVTCDAREICNQIAHKMMVKINPEYNDKKRMPSQNNIFKLFIDEDSEDFVCEFFRRFIEEFNRSAKEKYRERYISFDF